LKISIILLTSDDDEIEIPNDFDLYEKKYVLSTDDHNCSQIANVSVDYALDQKSSSGSKIEYLHTVPLIVDITLVDSDYIYNNEDAKSIQEKALCSLIKVF
jgi:hypothetical protein